jgi:hypothetical protein
MSDLITKRCRGWHFAGHIGAIEHQLPKTSEFFHASNYATDGFNGQCKACVSAYGSYRLRVDRERREAKKNAAGVRSNVAGHDGEALAKTSTGDTCRATKKRVNGIPSPPAASPEVAL